MSNIVRTNLAENHEITAMDLTIFAKTIIKLSQYQFL